MHCLSAPEDSACSRNLPLFVDAQTQERQGSGMWNSGSKSSHIRFFNWFKQSSLQLLYYKVFFFFFAVILHVSPFSWWWLCNPKKVLLHTLVEIFWECFMRWLQGHRTPLMLRASETKKNIILSHLSWRFINKIWTAEPQSGRRSQRGRSWGKQRGEHWMQMNELGAESVGAPGLASQLHQAQPSEKGALSNLV